MIIHRGFTLIELLIGIACITAGIALLIHTSSIYYQLWQKSSVYMRNLYSLHAACATMRRDIERAPQNQTLWKVINNDELIWHDEFKKREMRYCLKEGRLERCEGAYDTKKGTWSTQATSVLAYGVDSISFVPYYMQVKIVAFSVKISINKQIKEEAFIALRGKEL